MSGQKIAITTPTGNVGRHAARMLVRAGVRPTVLVRNPAKLDADIAPLVDAVATDQRDRDAVVAATADVDALWWINPPGTGDDPIADYTTLGEVAATAVRENGIGRVVFQSSSGAELRHGAGEIDGLGRTEELLEKTDAAVVHLRCGFFFTNLILQLDAIKAGTVPISLPVDAPLGWVDPRDIAETAVLRLLGPAWQGRDVQGVHGPEDLSWLQAMEIVSQATGRTVTAEQIPDDDMRQLLSSIGLNDATVEATLGMSTGLRDGFTPEQPRTAASTTPSTLAAWAFSKLRPLLDETN